jgi:hypothetical protein
MGIKSGGTIIDPVIVEPNPAVSNLLFHLNSNIDQRAAVRFFNKMGAMNLKRK